MNQSKKRKREDEDEVKVVKEKPSITTGSNWSQLKEQMKAKETKGYHHGFKARTFSQKEKVSVEKIVEKIEVDSDSIKGEITSCLAIDCEMVGVGDNDHSALARVSIVNFKGECVYDSYVKPLMKVTDYRTAVSGIKHEHLQHAPSFKSVQYEVAKIIKDKLLIGHAIKHDLTALLLSHPKNLIRDTSRYKPLCVSKGGGGKGRPRKLKVLAFEHLNMEIQGGEHSSVIDARATMLLYKKFSKEWESKKTITSHIKKSRIHPHNS